MSSSAHGPQAPMVVSISSHVASGTIGNRAIAFALETLGVTAITVNTASLPYHPGRGKGERLIPDDAAFARYLDDLAGFLTHTPPAVVVTGYMASLAQIVATKRFLSEMKRINPRLLVICDPVIGDKGGLYVAPVIATGIRDQLLPFADLATPNVHELAWLATGSTASVSSDDVQAHAAIVIERCNPLAILATSSPATGSGRIGNLLIDGQNAELFVHVRVEGPANGAGDLTTGLVAAHLALGRDLASACRNATASVAQMMMEAAAAGRQEMAFAAGREAILHPPRMFETVEIGSETICVGVDGCPAGWIAVYAPLPLPGETGPRDFGVRVFANFVDLLAAFDGAFIAVDMPIGLPAMAGSGGRGPESAVRPLLGARQSSVFSIASRAAVYAPTYSDACDIALATSLPPRKVSKQAYMLFGKIRELDALMTPLLQQRVVEAHPELAFWRMNGGKAVQTPKKIKSRVNPAGMDERRALLEASGIPRSITAARPPRGAAADDLLDACACLTVAWRLARNEARPFPTDPKRDAKGLQMAIWT